jgi:transcriptional regulator with XRE-family HTH domain
MNTTKYPDVRLAYRSARNATEPHLSQEVVADLAGVTRRHLIRIENGEHRPTTDLRDRIAAVLSVDPSSLPAVEDEQPFRAEAA